ncbi:MAG: hypothetical protein ACKO3T_25545 [Planctomycetaceae bacterium]
MLSDSETADSDVQSAVHLVRRLFAQRWFCIAGALVGLLWEVVTLEHQARYRTDSLLRLVSPMAGYVNRPYWDTVSRTRISQMKSLVAALDDTARITVRADGDPWLLKTEILCPAAGQGPALADRLLRLLNAAAQSVNSAGPLAATAAGAAAAPATKSAVAEFRHSLAGLELLVRQLEQRLGVALNPVADDAALLPVAPGFPDQAGKLPIEAVPYYGWYSRLQWRMSGICELAVENQQPEISAMLEDAGGRLEQAASGLALAWAESSVAAASHQLPECRQESLRESTVSRWPAVVTSCLTGLWLGAIAGVAIGLPLAWLQEHWKEIVHAS